MNLLGDDLVLTLHDDGILYLQDQGGKFNDQDFTVELWTRWLGATEEPQVQKWWRAFFTLDAQAAHGPLLSWRTANTPVEFPTASFSAETLITGTDLDEGSFLDIGETARFIQFRIRQTESATILAHVFPNGNSPFYPFVLGGVGAGAVPSSLFRLEPPLTVKSFPLPRRTF